MSPRRNRPARAADLVVACNTRQLHYNAAAREFTVEASARSPSWCTTIRQRGSGGGKSAPLATIGYNFLTTRCFVNQINLLVITTRREAEQTLEAAGVTGAALEALLRDSAPARHQLRVRAATEAAHAWAHRLYPAGSFKDNLLAMAILHADCMGVGGKDGVQGAATARHPAFRRCGKGRKQASDGDAWTAAIAEAASMSAGAGYGFVAGWDGAVYFGRLADAALVEDSDGVQYFVDISPAMPLGHLRTVAREGLRRAAGLTGWHWRAPFHSPPESLPSWAAAVNRVEAAAAQPSVPDTDATVEPPVAVDVYAPAVEG